MALSSGQQGTTTNRELNKLQYAVANIAAANATVAGGDVVLTFDASANYEPKYSTIDEIILNDASAVFTNIDAGASGTAGTVDVFPSTASKGKLTLAAVNNDGDTTTTLSNAAMAQASVISFPDPGAATANVLLTSAANDQSLVTATATELNYLDITTLGTGAASKAVVLDANGAYVGPTATTTKFTWSVTSTSTDGGTSVEPFVHNTTMTGVGGVGGRARFELDTNVALGGWANALKAQTEFGASGRVTGLGSAFVAELTLSAGTSSGTYAPLELELNLGSGASTGTATSLIYASVNGADAATFDTNGYFLTLAGVTVAGAKIAATGTITNVNEITHGLRVKIAGSDYFLLAATAANFNA